MPAFFAGEVFCVAADVEEGALAEAPAAGAAVDAGEGAVAAFVEAELFVLFLFVLGAPSAMFFSAGLVALASALV